MIDDTDWERIGSLADIGKSISHFIGIDFGLIPSLLGPTIETFMIAAFFASFAFSKEIGMDIDKYFKKVVYTGSHELSTVAVDQGKVDAAFVASHRFDNVVTKGEVKLEDFNIIWSSPPIPQDPFVYRSPLCEDIKKNIRNTFLGLKDDPNAQTFLDNVKSNTFVSMTSADYDVIRELKKAKDAKKAAN